MKLSANLMPGRRHWNRSGFTLLEMMFSVGIYTILLIGVLVAIQVFALRVYTLAATKLTATQGARQALNQIRDDIRGGKYVQVGNTDNQGDFTPYNGTNLAVGNAIQVYPTTNGSANWTTSPYPAPYNIYYLQTNTPGGVSSNNLMWISVQGSNSVITAITTNKLCTYITNLDVFATMDCLGIITSNAIKNNWLYTVKMQFYQWEYPIAIISSNPAANAYDYYQLRTRVARRSLN
jgi:type II secretory pathway pseudopilin PulG